MSLTKSQQQHNNISQSLILLASQPQNILLQISRYQSLLSSSPSNFTFLINLSVLYLQSNNLEKAQQTISNAIQVEPFNYIGYYNMGIGKILREKNNQTRKKQSIISLKIALSLLLSSVGQIKDDIKLVNNAIKVCPKNIKAYLIRAKLYEKQQKIKMAQNQYERLTQELFQENIMGSSLLASIYLEKTLFYRRINNVSKLQQNLSKYLQYKNKSNIPSQIEQKYNLYHHFFPSQQASEFLGNISNFDQQIFVIGNDIKGLIQQLSEDNKKIVPILEASEKIAISQEQSQRVQLEPVNVLTQPISKQSTSIPLKPSAIDEQNLLLDETPSANQQSQSQSISYNQDQDSAILNQKIQKLQNQIKQSGGKVPQLQDLSRDSVQQKFLEYEIEKTMDEILKQKQRDGQRSSAISDQAHSTRTYQSKLSTTEYLSGQEMQQFSGFLLESRSVSMFSDKGKKDAWVKVTYLGNSFETGKCKTDKMTWNHVFDRQILQHGINQKNEQQRYEINVSVYGKQSGWLGWQSEGLIGQGCIKISDKGQTKCTLENKGKKIGILYYKLKLMKEQEE